MHPAYSVILFTTASGAGYGLLIWLGLFASFGLLNPERWFGFVAWTLAFGLITAGLLSSTLHLGRPERAWRAFSQWRSSWLSREGVLAVATYVPAGLVAFAWVFFETDDGIFSLLALLAALLGLATVWCTGMIYQSLTTIRAWNQTLVTPIYLALALATGAVLLNLVLELFGVTWVPAAALAASFLAVAMVLKLLYWRTIDEAPRDHTIGSATGLGRFGTVRVLDPPHTQPNYVMREMGYAIARKHAKRLRRMTVITAFLIPIAASLLSILFNPIADLLLAVTAALSVAVGVVFERWLFFAEAEHVVMLYYGRQAA